MLKRARRTSVERIAAEIVDDVAAEGECDFVADVAAALPLRIICDMMGIPASQYELRLRAHQHHPRRRRPRVRRRRRRHLAALLTAGDELAALMTDVGRVARAATARRRRPHLAR